MNIRDLLANQALLDGMSHSELYSMRGKIKDKKAQSILAPYEHQAFAREFTEENPLNTVSLAAAIPLYTLGKATGLVGGTRSPASLSELTQGFRGVGQGLSRWANKRFAPE